MALSIGGCATEQDEPKSSSFIDSNNMDETNKIIAVKSGYIYSFSDEVPVGPAIDSFYIQTLGNTLRVKIIWTLYNVPEIACIMIKKLRRKFSLW